MARYPAADAPPQGLQYVPEFISSAEESGLLREIAQFVFDEVYMHGVIAKRRVLHFGWDYRYEEWSIHPTIPLPKSLEPLRERVAAYASLPPGQLEEILVTEYAPGAGIGWHRDAPMFGPAVYGVSLASPCTMRFRRKRGRSFEAWSLDLAPRSLYVLDGPARSVWQHTIPAAKSLRYSVTFRTIQRKATRTG